MPSSQQSSSSPLVRGESSTQEVEELRQQLDELRNEVRQLRAAPATKPSEDVELVEPVSFNRRSLLGKAGVAAGAAVATVALGSKPAAADPGDLTLGAVNTTANRTELRYTSTADTATNLFTVQDGTYSTSSRRAAVGGFAVGDAVYNGVYGYTEGRVSGDAWTGHAIVAYGGSNSRSSIFMVPFGGDPRNETLLHARGSMRMTNSALWLCTASGTPGEWRRLVGQESAGAYETLSVPQRAYDSRPLGGPVAPNTTRVVSVLVPGMPSRPRAVTGTIVAVTPAGASTSGWFTVWNGTGSIPTIATINYNRGQVVTSSAFTSAVSDTGTISINCGNLASHVVVDITGGYA